MLDRIKVAKALENKSAQLFFDYTDELQQAKTVWHHVCNDPLTRPYIEACPQLQLPLWSGALEHTTFLQPWNHDYTLVSVDGSQIYPDKHQGTTCFLINIGSVSLAYKPIQSYSWFNSEPFIFVDEDFDLEGPNVVDIVNGKREEFELQVGLEQSLQIRAQHPDVPLLFMFDGSLVFWHLEKKDELLKHYFLQAYNNLLLRFYQEHIPVIGYISLSKSKDLVQLLRAYTTQFRRVNTTLFTHLVDAHIASFFLEEGHFSTIFTVETINYDDYPPEVRPCFMYYNTGSEYVRLELPFYVTQDKELLHTALRIVIDQVTKGNGYPISIAEAHHQAVVQGPDRDFFYYMIEKIGINHSRFLKPSEKSMKKRKMSI